MNKFTKAAIRAAALISIALPVNPAISAGKDGFAILGGPGSMKCKDAIKEINRSETSLHFFTIWLGGMATGVNFATPGLQDINPKTNNEGLFRLIIKQCVAEPDLSVAAAAGKIFKLVSEREGSWSKAPAKAADNPLAERVD